MRRTVLLAIVIWFVVAAVGYAASISVTLSADPVAVARGADVTYTAVVENSGAAAHSDLTLLDNLPYGLDQWHASYRRDGGTWMAYPANGIIPIGTLAAGTTTKIEIKAAVGFFAPGEISNTVTITDTNGPLTTKTIVVNVLPAVDAGADKMVGPNGTVDLSDASASDGGDGIASYSWSDNGAGGSFSDSHVLHPVYTAPTASGLFVLTLTVTDNQGGITSDSLRLRVDAFPTVDAGADKTVDEGKTIALSDATASDPDDWIEHYQWSDGGAGGSFSPSAQVCNPTYTAPLVSACAGKDVTLTLTVTDHYGAQTSNSLILHVNNVNVPPTATASPDKHVHSGDVVTLTGTGTDSDGTIAAYAWTQVSGPVVTLHGENTTALTFTAPTVTTTTTLRFRLTVTDDCGATDSDEAVVTVAPAPAPPPPSPPPVKSARVAVEINAVPTRATIGDRVTYTYTVRNTGEAQLVDVNVRDDKLGAIGLDRTTLAPGETAIGHATTTIAVSDFPGPRVDTVTATARTADGREVHAQARTMVELYTLPAYVTITITAIDARGFPLTPFSPLKIGNVVTYVYRITNTGKAKLDRISAVDDRLGPVHLSRTALAPWESVTGTLTRTITEADLPGPVVNTGTVVAYDPTGHKLTDTATITLLQVTGAKTLELTKSVDATTAAVGDTLVYTYTITNAGQVTVTDLVLTDDHLGTIPLPTTVLLPGQSITVTATYTVTAADLPGPLTNEAHITGRGTVGTVSSNATTASVTLTGGVAGGGGAVTAKCDGRVIISEVAWAGTPSDPDAQWIELENLGDTPVDLTGWRIGWYPNGKDPHDKSVWTWIPLQGTISPSPTHPCTNPRRRPKIAFVKQPGNDYAWQVVDMDWWVAGKHGKDGRGFYLLERGSDATVRDVAADLVYRALLPRAGAVIELVSAGGKVVDTANAGHPNTPGWVAGNAHTRATMERTNPLGPDTTSNWHTNPGVLVYGTDSAGDRLFATAGKPNSPDLNTLVALAEDQVTPVVSTTTVSLPVGNTRPWVKVAAVGIAAAGGGGSAPAIKLSTANAGGYTLAVDPTTWAPGSYFIWITNAEGKAILVPIQVK